MIVGGPLSVAAGLLLASVAFVVIAFYGVGSEGNYCSASGKIGEYEYGPPGKVAGYLDEGWSGFPPRQSCSVFLLDANYGNPPASVEEELRRQPPPHHLLAHGIYPGSQERLWVVGLLLLPPAIWFLFVVATVVKRRRAAALRTSPE
ncbi:MAG: hypothetical protein JST59_14295 [Actinobacteria bacterium]|nr:hypothetical protein [Actinomycetota bacterium]